MKYAPFLALALAVCVQSLPLHRNYEQPDFSITRQGAGYQIRHYPSAYWVSTDVSHHDKDQALGIGYGRLFNYIHGGNIAGMGNLRAVPVLLQVPESTCLTCEKVFTVSFYLPKLVASPPEPLDPSVYINLWEDKDMYVREFTAYSATEDFSDELARLRESVVQDEGSDLSLNAEQSMLAIFDGPNRKLPRRNEVWINKM